MRSGRRSAPVRTRGEFWSSDMTVGPKFTSSPRRLSERSARVEASPQAVNEPAVLWCLRPNSGCRERRQATSTLRPSSQAHLSCHNSVCSRPERCAGAWAKTNAEHVWLRPAKMSLFSYSGKLLEKSHLTCQLQGLVT